MQPYSYDRDQFTRTVEALRRLTRPVIPCPTLYQSACHAWWTVNDSHAICNMHKPGKFERNKQRYVRTWRVRVSQHEGVGNAVISREPPRGKAFDSVPSAKASQTPVLSNQAVLLLSVCGQSTRGNGDSRHGGGAIPATAPSMSERGTMMMRIV